MLALEALLGPILARTIIAVALLLIAVIGYFGPRMISHHAPKPAPVEDVAEETANLTRDQRIAMVIEALLLGFSMGSRKTAEKH